ncbi:TIGR00730 family Rossman fold protein [Paenibacillus allorhizosphaerae]|uniref:Cytokinin riboside 5'-monophosphate phosphoribohydrolase n=1 Tax=Paenibacillus allorhizosphaerae TaxID=2849866 RepID=A0ABM8VQQ9_9BACL|nr:TIGR00730 family Rossman fold protein [Paenibacillus allorhizosphaerae]CAG7654498.1 LOG family protein YvdD [Paenibacillus allorhizosphaerae]
MKRICVFAGSNTGNSPEYAQAAKLLGQELASREMELVYGGSRMGLMGLIADTVLAGGGKAIGVMPKGLFRGEMVHSGLTELREVDNMHQRKAAMSELADAFVALPGGLGTFEELFEVLSWSQLGIHQKPVGLLNVKQFYTPLSALISHAIGAGFARPSNMDLFLVEEHPAELVNGLQRFTRTEQQNKWGSA